MPGELNVFGIYQAGPWKDNRAIEAAVKKGLWNPSTAELKALAQSGKGAVEGVFNSYNLLCAIIRHKPDRVNIFAHANQWYLYFVGHVVSGDVEWDTRRPENALDVDFLDGQEKNDIGFQDSKTNGATFKQFRQALSSRSTICLYACHAALGGELCKGIADYFKTSVRGFADEVRYHPSFTDKGKMTMKYSIGDNPQVNNFHELDGHFAAPFIPSSKSK